MSSLDIQEKTTTITSSQNSLNGLFILKRDMASFAKYERSRIFNALEKAFVATEDNESLFHCESLHQIIMDLTLKIEGKIGPLASYKIPITVEKIQNFLEKQLMEEGYHEVARSFILYREKRTAFRQANASVTIGIETQLEKGHTIILSHDVIRSFLLPLVTGLNLIDVDLVVSETLKSVYHNMPIRELYQAMIMASRSLIENEPQYSFLAARLLLVDLKKEAMVHLKIDRDTTENEAYRQSFIEFIPKAVEQGILDPDMKNYPIAELAQALKLDRDLQFQYLGLQTLYDRYFIHESKVRYELPQVFFMRVAMGLAKEETDRFTKTLEFYNLLSSFDFMSSTPTLFNSGTTRPQLSSCYLTTVSDDLYEIYNAIRDNAMLSKFAGGLGNDWTNVRGMNSHIQGTNGSSQGVIPFLKVVNDTAIAVNQGGKRKGAVCAYLEAWHRDIEEFIELRKNTGDERRRTHDMNTALWVPDLFMERVRDDANWTLFSPNETPELHDLYGREFQAKYEEYESKATQGIIKNSKTLSAKQLWRKVLAMIFETGHPWITFKDPCNIRSPQKHCGVVHSSNLCTEITLNTSSEEIAVCNLGSINLPAHIHNGQIDSIKLKKTVATAIRMLDNVININYYSVDTARKSNFSHRPIGLGIMGFQDALYLMDIPYDSLEAITFADRSMEEISYYAIESSADLAQERGTYLSFEGSLWSQGILPIDSIAILKDQRRNGKECLMDTSSTRNWAILREKVKLGMRNSNVLAIAPTATIANICGVSQSIEPSYQNLYVKSNLSGEFTMINPYLVEALKIHGLWDKAMIHDLKYYDGQVQSISRIPDSIKNMFKTAFQITPQILLEAASRRQKWIDQSQSLNLYIPKASGKMIDMIYQTAWELGLKTTYYCRTLGATDAEKSTIHDKKLNAVKLEPNVCSIDNSECESCQ